MNALKLTEEDVDQNVIVKVKKKEKLSHMPLSDMEVTPKTDANFWPVREYVIWFANRC